MDDIQARVARLAADLVAIDSRSSVSNLAVADRIEQELKGFEVVRVDYADGNGVAKRALIAHRGPKGGYALSGHMDTVPDTGWQENPWDPRIDAAGVMHGLGSVDMKGAVAACILAAQLAAPDVPATLLITTDEETTKDGARALAAHPYRPASASRESWWRSRPGWCRCAATAPPPTSGSSPAGCRRIPPPGRG